MKSVKQFEQFTDPEIIRRVVSGEASLYEILIRRYNPYLYKVGRGYGFHHHDTEDLMQETYISAYKNLENFENRSTFKTWLVKIMLHHCYRMKHKFSFQKELITTQSIHENSIPMFSRDHDGVERKIINRELGHLIESALLNIPESYRMVFLLRELNGMSVAETSTALNISQNNVKIRMNRAKKMLSAEIQKLYSPDDIFEFNLIYCDRIVNNVMSKILNRKED